MPKGPKAQFTSTNSSDDDSSEYEYGVIGMVSDARKVELMSINDKVSDILALHWASKLMFTRIHPP